MILVILHFVFLISFYFHLPMVPAADCGTGVLEYWSEDGGLKWGGNWRGGIDGFFLSSYSGFMRTFLTSLCYGEVEVTFNLYLPRCIYIALEAQIDGGFIYKYIYVYTGWNGRAVCM